MTGNTFLDALIFLAVFGLIVYVCWWGLKKLALPEPFNKIATVILVLVVVVVLVRWLQRISGVELW